MNLVNHPTHLVVVNVNWLRCLYTVFLSWNIFVVETGSLSTNTKSKLTTLLSYLKTKVNFKLTAVVTIPAGHHHLISSVISQLTFLKWALFSMKQCPMEQTVLVQLQLMLLKQVSITNLMVHISSSCSCQPCNDLGAIAEIRQNAWMNVDLLNSELIKFVTESGGPLRT